MDVSSKLKNVRSRSRSIFNLPFLALILLSLILPNVYSHMDMDELKSVYYGLDIVSEPVVMDENVPLGAVHVTSKFGQSYQCSFPDHAEEEKKKEEEEKLAVEIGVAEMLKPLASKDCLFKTKDWWSYEFCYGKYVRQYHMEDGEIRGNIIYLGYYESDFDWNNETAKDERLRGTLNGFHSQLYSQGTKCDLTGNMRTTEVRFTCEENSEDYLARIDESQTCVYTMTVMTSRICRHPYFKSPVQRKSVPITCNPLLTQDEFDHFHEEKYERMKALERFKIEQETKKAAQKVKPTLYEGELSSILESAMSAQAKELLAGSLSKDKKKDVNKEEFEKMFGKNEQLWRLYQKGLAILKKQKKKKLNEQKEKETASPSGKEDEDKEILSEFENEIDEIKHRFRNSQNKLASLRNKMSKERNWDSEIEIAIKEAEQEFGMKVDRSLVAGLSDTLNKLVDKLEDTEAELNSMDDEINNLKPGVAKGVKAELKQKLADESDSDKTTVSSETDGNAKETEEDDVVSTEDVVDKSNTVRKEVDEDSTVKDLDEKAPVEMDNVEDKIEAPPMTGEPRKESSQGGQSTFPRPKDESEELPASEDEESELKIKLSVAGDEEAEAEMKKLPGNVRKLLEDSVRKEYEKRSVKRGAGSEKLGLDDDHSFTRDKSVHVIQQEDEDGRTNRFIFVLGFNNYDDESAEIERQSALEENYGFVYKGSKRKKTGAHTESQPDR